MTFFSKIAISFICIIVLLISYTYFSPKPAAKIIKILFKNGVAVEPSNYNQLKSDTTQYDNLDYNSHYKDGQLDIVVPKSITGVLPTIIWIHGGAYVGGDKKDVTEYAVQLAAKGYAVVNMNYELAPSAKYPTPLKQMDEVYQFIVDNADKYHLDAEQLFIAGDSAGAQIASQYVNIQVDSTYADQVGLQQKIPSSSLMGALLFCGPYDLAAFDNMSSNKIFKFFLNRVAWSYIGNKDWQSSPITQHASITDYVSKKYIPTFITDGNSGSFEEHGKKLATILNSYNIPTKEVFYPREEAELGHEYQFIMNLPESQNTFDELVKFLNENKKQRITH